MRKRKLEKEQFRFICLETKREQLSLSERKQKKEAKQLEEDVRIKKKRERKLLKSEPI